PTAAQWAILAKPREKRTKQEQAQIEDLFLNSNPEIGPIRSRLQSLQAEHDQLEARAPTSMVLRELAKQRPNNILKRGDFRTPGQPGTPCSPKVMGGLIARPDRLGLARWLVDPKNPLTARVEVNRLWEQCFGRGLVATPEDFGTQGDAPSNAELL